MNRTIFTAEDVKNIVENIFNGNMAISRASKGAVKYVNENSEPILMIDEEDGVQTQSDLAEYLNIDFYSWRNRLVESQGKHSLETLENFDAWVESLNFSMNKSYALVEIIDESVTQSQDIDSAEITAKITFIMQTNKIKNLDYYVSKIRNNLMAVPQEIQNSYGNIINAYILMGKLMYDSEPEMLQYGEVVIVSTAVRISYLTEALSYNDTKVEISLDGDDQYDENGAIVGATKYLTMPITKSTWQAIVTSNPVPTANRPDLTGYCASSLSTVKTLSFYDFNKGLTLKFNDLFWSCGAYRVDGKLTTYQEVNIPVFIRVTSNGKSYVFKDMVDNMQKTITNGDFNISSITLRGWGKIQKQ